MDVAVPASHWAERRSQISAQRIQNSIPKGEPSCLITNQRCIDITTAQVHTKSNAECFLTAAQKNTSDDFSRAIESSKFLLQDSRLKHRAKGASGDLSGSSSRPASIVGHTLFRTGTLSHCRRI